MLFAAVVSPLYYVLSALGILVGVTVVVGGTWGILRLVKGQSVRSIAETAAADVARMKDLYDSVVVENQDLKRQVDSLTSQLEALRLVVSGSSKIDAFREEYSKAHAALSTQLTRIEKAIINGQ